MSTFPGPPQRVNLQVLADHVYQELLASLMDGRLQAGAGISIEGMSRELDVSPTPIREESARLESTGLVRRVALRGNRVAALFTTEELAELMDARLVVEPGNAERACERAAPEVYAQLEQCIVDLKTAPRGGFFSEFRSYWEADERFHRLIAVGGHDQFLLAAYKALGRQVQRYRLFGGLGVTDAEHAIAEHSAVLDAFRARDPQRPGR